MSSKFFRWTIGLAAFLGAGFTLTGCGDGEGQSARLLSGEKKLSAEDERIQNLMKIRYWDQEKQSWQEDRIGNVAAKMGGLNYYRGPVTGVTDVCRTGVWVSDLENFLSIALATNKLARSLVPIEVYDQDHPTQLVMRVPAQEYTAKVALHYATRSNALEIMGGIMYKVAHSSGSDLTKQCRSDDSQIYGGRLAEMFSLAYNLYIDSIDGAVEASTIAGDVLRNKAPSDAEGRLWQYSAKEFSRVAAARLITWPAGEAFTDKYDPFCASAALTSTQRRALSLIRIAAPSPGDIMDSNISTGALIGGNVANLDPSSAQPHDGTLSQRLALFLPMSDLSSSSSDLLQAMNLSLEDFSAARTYVQREIVALKRSSVAILDPGSSAAYFKYAATASDGKPLPDAAYAAQMRQNWWVQNGYYGVILPESIGDPLQFSDSLSSESDPGLDAMKTLVAGSLTQYAATITAQITSVTDEGKKARLEAEYRAPLMGILDRIRGEAWGRLVLRLVGEDLAFFGEYRSSVTSVEFVAGYDGLRCLLDGNIEGAACQLSNYKLTEQLFMETDCNLASDMFPCYRLGLFSYPDVQQLRGPAFMIVSEDYGPKHVVFAFDSTRDPSPGVDIGSTLIFEDSIRRVGELLSLNADWCGETQRDCMGNPVGEKLPLENELSKDGLDVESSWKHYLDLANQAAAEAELRGKEYMNAGLEVERRKEEIWKDRDTRARQAVEQLQDICGSAMDPRKLLDYLQGANLALLKASTCNSDTECNPSGQVAAYRCVAGQCVADFSILVEHFGKSDPDLARLSQCVSSKVVDFATPGDKPLCLWTDDGNENKVCQGGDVTMPCPRLPADTASTSPDTACDSFPKPSGSSWRLLPESATLKYFQIGGSEQSASNVDVLKICEDIRVIRATLGGSDVSGTGPAISVDERERRIQEIRDSGLFHTDTFSEGTRDWYFEVVPESNIRISVNGSELWTTGRVGLDSNTASSNWPCGASSRPADCTSTTAATAGIMCDYVDCSNAWKRGDLVLRLVNAARLMRMGRRSDAAGDVRFDLLPRWYGVEEAPCDTSETLVARIGKTPVRMRKCGESTFVTTDGNANDRTIWNGSRAYYGGIPTTVSLSGEVADWVVDNSLNSGHLVLHAGPGQWSGWKLYDVAKCSSGLLNGLSRAMEISDSCSADGRYKNLALNTLSQVTPDSEEVVVSNDPSKSVGGFDYNATGQSALDAMELYCQARAQTGFECVPGAPPPPVNSAADLATAAKHLQCVGDGIISRAGMTLLANVPEKSMDALRKISAIGSFPEVGGKYGEAVSRLRAALVELSDVGPAIGSEIRQMGNDIDAIGAALRINKIHQDIADAQFLSSMSTAIGNCASAGFSFGAIGQCANMLAQVQFLSQIKNLEKEAAEQAGIRDLAQFRNQLEARSRTLAAYGNRINASFEQIDAQLAALEGLRLEAQRHAAEAIYAASYGAPNSAAISNTLAWTYLETRRRYEASTKIARSLAILARRSIEQRLGIRLDSLKDQLPLVDAPSSWVQGICQAEGISFEEIGSGGSSVANATDADASGDYKYFLGNYVADYVSKLERTVESYRIAYPFQDGVDEAIVSVRNDLSKTRASCEVASSNLLPNSQMLDELTGTSTPGSGWTEFDCSSGTLTTGFAGCIQVAPGGGTYVQPNGEPLQFYTLNFDMSHCGVVGCVSSSSPKFGSTVKLESGWYKVSAYFWEAATDTCLLAPTVVNSMGAQIAVQEAGAPKSVETFGDSTYILRKTWKFKADASDAYSVRFGEATSGGCTGGVALPTSYVANVMLARQSAGEWNDNETVPNYEQANAAGETWLPLCNDSSGASFRQNVWSKRKCVRLCDDGYSAACDERSGRLECYRELRFSLDENRLENSELFQGAGFAKGNFNYRIEELGVNFVGTGVKNCTSSSTPDSCMTNANVQYTIEHLGPFYVRNHMGDDVESKIFNGRIEHARGLASERYLTNPLSSTDRTLLQPYVRSEFQGRPLGGEYVVKVWESPEVDFDRIEDVQFYLRYRYWTRQN